MLVHQRVVAGTVDSLPQRCACMAYHPLSWPSHDAKGGVIVGPGSGSVDPVPAQSLQALQGSLVRQFSTYPGMSHSFVLFWRWV